MSTLNVANISDDQSTLTNSVNPSDKLNNTTTVDTKFVTNGCAKVWVKLNQNAAGSGDQIINSSLNVTNLTDAGLGTTEVNLTSAMDADNYPVSGAQSGNQAGNLVTQMSSSSKVYGAFYVNTTAATYIISDCNTMQLALHGDLA